MNVSNPPTWYERWQRFASATVRGFHLYASWLVSISWRRFIVLAVLLLIGSVSGAQIGAQLAQKLPAERLRFILAAIVLVIALRMALGLGWRPDEIYTVTAQ